MPDTIDPKKLEEALKPYKEKADLASGFIDEIREKLGDEKATEINDTLIGLQGTLVEASQIVETTVTDNLTTKERNSKLVEVNNDLYIKNSQALKGNQTEQIDANDMDDEEALDAFTDSVIGGK